MLGAPRQWLPSGEAVSEHMSKGTVGPERRLVCKRRGQKEVTVGVGRAPSHRAWGSLLTGQVVDFVPSKPSQHRVSAKQYVI